MSTLQVVIRDRLQADPFITSPEPGGLGFSHVYSKWLVEDGPGAEPDQFNTNGTMKPSIVVWQSDTNRHPSLSVPGLYKWDTFPTIYLIHYPHDHGKDILDQAVIAVEQSLMDPTWQPVITGGQLPRIQTDGSQYLDNSDQFPGNYVVVLRLRVTGARSVPI